MIVMSRVSLRKIEEMQNFFFHNCLNSISIIGSINKHIHHGKTNFLYKLKESYAKISHQVFNIKCNINHSIIKENDVTEIK